MMMNAHQQHPVATPWSVETPRTELGGVGDPRWLTCMAIVLALLGVGVLIARFQGPVVGTSFSVRVSAAYVPLASILILFWGWSPTTFPLAAGVFYGYLATAQAAHAEYFLMGDSRGALTYDIVLAVPLLIVGLVGPAAPGTAPAPSMMVMGIGAVFLSALISTLLAFSPSTAAPTLVARFLLPIFVTLIVVRRLRGIDDYFVLWAGFLAGTIAISIFDYRRAVLGVAEWYATSVGQRYAGATGSFAIPAFYVCGAALWLGHGIALRRSVLVGVALISATAVFGMLLWVGAHRGPLVFMALLVLWWLVATVLRTLSNFRVLILALVGAAAVAGAVAFSLQRTSFDISFVFERFDELRTRGLTEEPRWHIWMRGMQYVADSPFWGVGLNNWVDVDTEFASIHSSLFGIIFDTGLFGLAAFGLLFGATLMYVRKPDLSHLPYLHQRFVLGCRAGWIIMLLVLVTNLPFTSGQPRNNIFAYAVYMYPLLVMVVCMRHPKPRASWIPAYGAQPGDAVVLPAAATPSQA